MKKAEENAELSNFSRLWIINECRSAMEELEEASALPDDAKAAATPV